MTDLKPCPFCAGEAKRKTVTTPHQHGWVGCPECGVYINWQWEPSGAEEKWNSRLPAADVVEVVRCAECVHRPTGTGVNHDVHFPSCDFTCPCRCDDSYYSWMPKDNWFCANGERMDGGQDDV